MTNEPSEQPTSAPLEESPGEIIKSFEQELERQEDTLYGVALFFEGISLLFAGQEAVVETYRKQFRNIIQIGKDAATRARELLDEAKQDPGKAALLKSFEFFACQGHPDPDAMTKRARALVDTYEELFPNKPRTEELSETETMRLMECAARKLD
jgi:hypothetical protein